MARDGNGTYSRPESDYVFDTVIDETKINNEMNQMATAMTDSIAKDGQTDPTANLPMATNKHTGVGAGTALTDYADVASVQDGGYLWGGTGGGTADVITFALSPAITAYATGQKYRFLASGANTGAVTVNINGVGATAVKKKGGTALAAGDIDAAGVVVEVVYDGTDFELAGFADQAKLDGIEAGATADQTNAEIKTAYEANSDTNEFSDAEQTKLSGIATGAEVSKLVKIAHGGTTARVTTTSTLAIDDSIPQQSELDALFTKAITPGNTANRLLIQVDLTFGGVVNQDIIIGLFQDATAGALAATYTSMNSSGGSVTASLTYEMAAGTESSTTFRVHAAPTSGAVDLNGDGSARILGGVSASTITITESTP